jgi:hypothetical protein
MNSKDRNFINQKEFSLTIESIVEEKSITYIDAVVWYCEENGLDTSQISCSKSLKEKIQVEAARLTYNMKSYSDFLIIPTIALMFSNKKRALRMKIVRTKGK